MHPSFTNFPSSHINTVVYGAGVVDTRVSNKLARLHDHERFIAIDHSKRKKKEENSNHWHSRTFYGSERHWCNHWICEIVTVPGPPRSWIFHHHHLGNVAKLAEILFEALCKKKRKQWKLVLFRFTELLLVNRFCPPRGERIEWNWHDIGSNYFMYSALACAQFSQMIAVLWKMNRYRKPSSLGGLLLELCREEGNVSWWRMEFYGVHTII